MRRDYLLRPTWIPTWPGWLPLHGILGLTFIAIAWPASWLQVQPLAEYSFFPLWVGYILVVDALVLRRRGTSLLTARPLALAGMFAASIPMWWAFEGLNQLTQNWYYLGAADYSPLRYALVASWHFSVVIPAVFETADLLASFGWVQRLKNGPRVPISKGLAIGAILLGIVMLAALFLWPRYAFPVNWLALFLLLDPINRLLGRPSILAQVDQRDWHLVAAFALGALVCGWFWEMWNFYAFPKWEYAIPFFEFVHIFEMPLLGYGGYLPFGLETYAMYHFMVGVFWWLGRGLGVYCRSGRK